MVGMVCRQNSITTPRQHMRALQSSYRNHHQRPVSSTPTCAQSGLGAIAKTTLNVTRKATVNKLGVPDKKKCDERTKRSLQMALPYRKKKPVCEGLDTQVSPLWSVASHPSTFACRSATSAGRAAGRRPNYTFVRFRPVLVWGKPGGVVVVGLVLNAYGLGSLMGHLFFYSRYGPDHSV